MNEQLTIPAKENFTFPSLTRHQLAKTIVTHLPTHRPIVFVCIGTDRSTGDALGPLVGHQLTQSSLSHFLVYGTIEHPVHAKNLEKTMEEIAHTHVSPYIVAIDACLGLRKHIGHVTFQTGPLTPGAAFDRSLPPVGHSHITGIVNSKGMMDFFVLQSTRLHHVLSMATFIASSIRLASFLYQKKKNKQPKLTFLDKLRLLHLTDYRYDKCQD